MIAGGLVLAAGLVVAAGLALYPAFDIAFHLEWGRQVIGGSLPAFEAPYAPTEHPLAVGVAILAAASGPLGGPLLIAWALAGVALMVVALAQMGRTFLPPFVALACALVGVSVHGAGLGASTEAFIDPFAWGLVLLAAATAASPQGSPFAVAAALGVAGLVRPEAWMIGGAWLAWVVARERRLPVRESALVAMGPACWVLLDLAVTGRPLFSFTHTTGVAEQLERDFGLGEALRILQEAVLHTANLPLGLVASALLVAGFRSAPSPVARSLAGLLAIVSAAFLAFAAVGLVPNMRYLMPVYAGTTLFIAWGCVAAAHGLADRVGTPRLAAATAVAALAAAGFAASLASNLRDARANSTRWHGLIALGDRGEHRCATVWSPNFQDALFVAAGGEEWPEAYYAQDRRRADCVLVASADVNAGDEVVATDGLAALVAVPAARGASARPASR